MAEPQVLQRTPVANPAMRPAGSVEEAPRSTHPAARFPQTQDQTESFGTGYQYRRALELITAAKASILDAVTDPSPGSLTVASGSGRNAPIIVKLPDPADLNNPFTDPETADEPSEHELPTGQPLEIVLSARSQAILETKRSSLAPHAAALRLLESLGEAACNGLSQDQKAALLELADSRFNDPVVQLPLREWNADPRSELPPIEVQLVHAFPALAEAQSPKPNSLLDSFLEEQHSATDTQTPTEVASVDPLVLERFETLRANLTESGLHQLELALRIVAERSYTQRNPESEILRDLEIAKQMLETELSRLLPAEGRKPEREQRRLELFAARPDLRMLCSVQALDQTCFADLPNLAYSYDRHIETDPRAEDGTLRLNLHTWTSRELSSMEQTAHAIVGAATNRLSAGDLQLLEARSAFECRKALEATLSWQADPQTRDEPIEHYLHRARWGQAELTPGRPDAEAFSPRIDALYSELKAQLHPVLERQSLLAETKRILDPFGSATQYEVRHRLDEITSRAQARFIGALSRSSGDSRAVLPTLLPGLRQLWQAPHEEFIERLAIVDSSAEATIAVKAALASLPMALRSTYQEVGLIQSLDRELESLRQRSADSPEFRIAETVNALATTERTLAVDCGDTIAELGHHQSDLARAELLLTESRSAATARLNATLSSISFGEIPWLSDQLDSAPGSAQLDQFVLAELRTRLGSAAPMGRQAASPLAAHRVTPLAVEPTLDAVILPAIITLRAEPDSSQAQPLAASLPRLARSETNAAQSLNTTPVSSRESVLPAFAHFSVLQELQRLQRGLSELSDADRVVMQNERLSEEVVFRRKLDELPSALYQVQVSALGFNHDERAERRAIPGIVVEQDALTLLEESRNNLYRLSSASEEPEALAAYRSQATEILDKAIDRLSTQLEVWQQRLDDAPRATLSAEWRKIVQPTEFQQQVSSAFDDFLKKIP